jgi:hypothetical protein
MNTTLSVYQMEAHLVDSKQATDYSLYVLSKDKTPSEYRIALEKFDDYSQRKDELDKLHADVERLDRVYDNYATESVRFVSFDEQVDTLEELALYKDKASIEDIWNQRHNYSPIEHCERLEMMVGLRENPDKITEYEYILEKYGDMRIDSMEHRATFLVSELCERGCETLDSLKSIDSYRRIHGMTTYVSVLEEVARAHDYKKSTGCEFYKPNIPEFIYIPFLTH